MITGVDLVEQQIRVARGEVLSIKQEDLSIKGHALELRVYAEDPLENFLPSVGTLITYSPPQGERYRVDDGYVEGMEIPIYYDPMIAKLITYGDSREEAIELMKEAILHYKIEGIATTLPFGTYVCNHEAFVSGNFDTHFVKDYYSADQIKEEEKAISEVAAIFAKEYVKDKAQELAVPKIKTSLWVKR
jgi:acetyl/propionyl-CoA carboxylase alpha subunit